MILPFSTHFSKDKGSLSGKETLFVQQIMSSETMLMHKDFDKYYDLCEEKGIDFNIGFNRIKNHTIRLDLFNRWKPGRKIQPALVVKTKNYFQFAPTFPCVSIQSIEISYKHGQTYIKIDNKEIDFETAVLLAKNDGFDSLAHFLTYFNEDFTGKIIHWTNLKY